LPEKLNSIYHVGETIPTWLKRLNSQGIESSLSKAKILNSWDEGSSLACTAEDALFV
jgi:hypothetical protein